jgi:hypothetical protein
MLLVPVTGIISASLLLGEPLGVREVLAMTLLSEALSSRCGNLEWLRREHPIEAVFSGRIRWTR